MNFEQILFGVLLPAFIAAAMFILGWRIWRRRNPYEQGHWAGAAAFTLAFAFSWISEKGVGSLRPVDKAGWIVYLPLAAGLIGLLAALWRRPKWAPWLAGLLLIPAAALLTKPIDNPTYALLGLPGLCGAVLVCWLLLEPLAARRPGASLPLAFMVFFTGLSIFAFMTDATSWPIVLGAMSGVGGAALVAAWLNPRLSFQRGATPLLAALPAAVLWQRAWYYYGEAPWFAFVLPLTAFGLLWLGELPLITKRPPWMGVVVRGLLVAIPVAIAVILAMKTGETDPYYGFE